MFNFNIAGITPRDIENKYKTFNFNINNISTGSNGGSGGGELPELPDDGGRLVKSIKFSLSLIDTGYFPNQNTEVRTKFTANAQGFVYGNVNNTNGALTLSWSATSQTTARFGRTTASLGIPESGEAVIIHNKDGATLNGVYTPYSGEVTDFTSTVSLKIGHYMSTTYNWFNGSMEYYTILENGKVLMDLRPYADADDKACFRDLVTGNKFYKTAGTGKLTYTE